MAVLLERIINHPKSFLGTAIYFAANNSETRFDIVQAALHAILICETPGEDRSKFAAEWTAFFSSLAKARAARNKITHGNITTVHRGDKARVRLTAPIFDLSRTVSQNLSGQWPGMSPHDVAAVAEKIARLARRTQLFSQAVNALHSDETPTLQKTFRELEDHRQRTSDHAKGAPTLPKP